MIAPAWSAPCSREIENDLLSFVEEIVEVVLHTIDVSGGEVRRDAAVWQLCERCRSEEEASNQSVNVFHSSSFSCSYSIQFKSSKKMGISETMVKQMLQIVV